MPPLQQLINYLEPNPWKLGCESELTSEVASPEGCETTKLAPALVKNCRLDESLGISPALRYGLPGI